MLKPKDEKPLVLPKGCVEARSPGDDRIIIQQPRGPGPWYRVKHVIYGQKLVRAKTPIEAVRKFAETIAPDQAQSDEWVRELAKRCRVGKAYD